MVTHSVAFFQLNDALEDTVTDLDKEREGKGQMQDKVVEMQKMVQVVQRISRIFRIVIFSVVVHVLFCYFNMPAFRMVLRKKEFVWFSDSRDNNYEI